MAKLTYYVFDQVKITISPFHSLKCGNLARRSLLQFVLSWDGAFNAVFVHEDATTANTNDVIFLWKMPFIQFLQRNQLKVYRKSLYAHS